MAIKTNTIAPPTANNAMAHTGMGAGLELVELDTRDDNDVTSADRVLL